MNVELPVADPAGPDDPPSGLGPGGPGFSLSSVLEASFIARAEAAVEAAVTSGVPKCML